MLTVAELISMLYELDPDLPVLIEFGGGMDYQHLDNLGTVNIIEYPGEINVIHPDDLDEYGDDERLRKAVVLWP